MKERSGGGGLGGGGDFGRRRNAVCDYVCMGVWYSFFFLTSVFSATITDADADNIQKVEVDFVSGFVLGDTFSFTDAHSVTGNYDSPTGKLTLTGPTTAANFQAALRTVYFKATSTYNYLDIPSNHNKVVKIIATDVNTDASVEELRAINITAPARVFTEWVTATVELS